MHLLRNLIAIAFFAALHDTSIAADRPNIVLICIDDLRPQTGAYGKPFMVTPCLDRLAEEGRLCERHYVLVPTCGASRYALLTGQLPSRPVSTVNEAFRLYREELAPPSMPQWFREHGYHTAMIGKVSHAPDGMLDKSAEVPKAWDDMHTPAGAWGTSWKAFYGYAGGTTRELGTSPAYEAADVDDQAYPDALLADTAQEKLRTLRDGGKPFFLAVGFYKPHLPFNAPKKYWDLYDRSSIDVSDVAPVVRKDGEIFLQYGVTAEQTADPDTVRTLHHAYYAATSFIDAQAGKVLAAIDDLGLRDNTIVVVWGDHGYHLGELGYWGKHTLFEYSLRSAFIVRTPSMNKPGRPTDAIVSTIDIYPTLTELAGLPTPDHLDGRSFADVVADPDATGNDHALSYWRKGVSIRTDRYRLTIGQAKPQLYDHQVDPGERTNIAADHPELVKDLAARIKNRNAARKAK